MRAAKNLDTFESIAMDLAEEHRRPASEEYDEAMAMAEDLEAAADVPAVLTFCPINCCLLRPAELLPMSLPCSHFPCNCLRSRRG